MPNDAATAKVICPFFHRFTREERAIICEGPGKDLEAGTLFRSSKAMTVWTGSFCNTFQYERCPVAQAATRWQS